MEGKPVAEQDIGRQLLKETAAYAESSVCRRKLLLHYFGEYYKYENCGNCDNCRNPKKQVEAKEHLCKVIQVILATKEKFKHRKPPMLGRCGKDNPTSKPVAMYNDNGDVIKVFDNSLIVLQELGIARESICRCCNGKQNKAGGFRWKYVEKEIIL